jgi:hypothetical protein
VIAPAADGHLPELLACKRLRCSGIRLTGVVRHQSASPPRCLDELLGDRGLARAVVLDRQPVDHVARVARGVVHGRHPRALLRGGVLEERREDLRGDPAGQQLLKDRLLAGLVVVERRAPPASSKVAGITCRMVGICEITDWKRLKKIVATSNSPASKRAIRSRPIRLATS